MVDESMVQAAAACGGAGSACRSTGGADYSDTSWGVAPSSSQAPDSDWSSDFNYIRYYPAQSLGVGGMIPGARYRISVRKQGDTGAGLWYETVFLQRRNILYYPMEPIGTIPPVQSTLTEPMASACLSSTVKVVVEVTDNVVTSGNVFSVRLSDVNGSFTNETTIGSVARPVLSRRLCPLPSLPEPTTGFGLWPAIRLSPVRPASRWPSVRVGPTCR